MVASTEGKWLPNVIIVITEILNVIILSNSVKLTCVPSPNERVWEKAYAQQWVATGWSEKKCFKLFYTTYFLYKILQ